MTENTFPNVKVDALVQFFRSEVLVGQESKHFTKGDITPSPKPDAIQRLYMRVLHLINRFRPECHYMVPLHENIQHPMLHEGVTPILSVYLLMSQFLPMCRVYDFQINDLLNPKTKRTINILSGIMNFLQFRKQRLLMTSEYQQCFRTDTDKLQAYTKGIKDAEKKIEKLTTIPPEQQAEDKELAAALSDLQNSTKHEYQEVNAMNEQVAEWKTEIAERSQKLTQKKMDVATLKEEIVALKSQIVESPEELRNEMEKMKDKVKNIKLSKEHADERLVELQIKVQGVNQSEAEFQLVHELLQDLQGSMNKMNNQQEEIQTLVALYEKRQKELRSLVTGEGQLKRALGMKTDKFTKQEIRQQKKREIKQQHAQNFLGDCEQVHQKREEMVDQIECINQETQRIKTKMENLRDVCNQETDKAQVLYECLQSALDQFHKRIENHLVLGRDDIIKMNAHY